jgi:hypothetical protein
VSAEHRLDELPPVSPTDAALKSTPAHFRGLHLATV